MRSCCAARIGLVFTLLLSAVAVNAQVYRWVDAQGQVHFGDKKPRQEAAELEKLEIRTGRPEADPQVLKNREAMSLLNQQRAGERAQQAREAAASELADKKHKASCAELKKQRLYERSVAVVYTYDEQGNRINWTAEQRQAYQARLRSNYEKYCQ